MLSGVQIVWGNEPSHSLLNYHCGSWGPKWTPKSWKCHCKGQNPSVQRVLYNIRKLLKIRCLNWAHMIHLDIWNTNYDQKKGRELNRQFDSQQLKVGSWTDFLTFRWRATYCWKALDEGYNFASYLITIQGLHSKLWVSKVTGIPIVGIPWCAPNSLRDSNVNPKLETTEEQAVRVSQPHFGQVWGRSPTLPKLGIWSPPGLPNV
jgi:hypothetical protein